MNPIARFPLCRAVLAALAFSALSAPAFSGTIRVPQDYPKIWDAVEAAGYGDVVKVAPGTYVGFVNIYHKSHVTIRGSGKDKTFVRESPGFIQTVVFQAYRSTDISISNLTVEGDSDYSFAGSEVRNLSIHDVRVRGEGGDEPGPIQFYGSETIRLTRVEMIGAKSRVQLGFTGFENGGAAEITSCRFTDVGGDALSIASSDARVERCRFDRIGARAIVISSGLLIGDATVARNDIDECGGDAISIEGSHFTRVEQNRVRKSGAHAAWVKSSIEADVRNNRISDSSGSGIVCDVAGSAVEDNRIDRSGLAGIAANAKGMSIVGNVIDRPFSAGIYVTGLYPIVLDNRILSPVGAGILAESSATEVELRGNIVSKSVSNGIEIRSDDGTLRENRVSGSEAYGFAITGIHCSLAKNRARGSALSDLYCDLEMTGVAGSNHFGTVQDIP